MYHVETLYMIDITSYRPSATANQITAFFAPSQ